MDTGNTNANRSARKALCNLKEKFVAQEKWGDRQAGWKDRDKSIGRNIRSVWSIATQPFSGWAETSHRLRVSADGATDGTERITSPDCPLHGDSSGSASILSCDEYAADLRSRSEHTGTDPAPEQPSVHALADQIPDDCSAGESSDSLVLSSSRAAIGHSKPSRKTGRDPLTNRPCKPSGETLLHTERSAREPSGSDLAGRTSESNTVPGGSGDHPSERTEHRNAGKICTCQYYNTDTKKESHFATFPEEIPDRCIRAGS